MTLAQGFAGGSTGFSLPVPKGAVVIAVGLAEVFASGMSTCF